MTLDEYIYLILAFLFSYVTLFFVRSFLRHWKLIKILYKNQITTEESAKRIDDITGSSHLTREIRLLPYVKLFQQRVLSITKDNRIYLNRTYFRKKLLRDLLILFLIYLFLGGLLFITITF